MSKARETKRIARFVVIFKTIVLTIYLAHNPSNIHIQRDPNKRSLFVSFLNLFLFLELVFLAIHRILSSVTGAERPLSKWYFLFALVTWVTTCNDAKRRERRGSFPAHSFLAARASCFSFFLTIGRFPI